LPKSRSAAAITRPCVLNPGQVGFHEVSRTSLRRDPAGDRRAALVIPPANHQSRRAPGAKEFGRSLPEALRPARDDRVLAVQSRGRRQIRIHTVSPSFASTAGVSGG